MSRDTNLTNQEPAAAGVPAAPAMPEYTKINTIWKRDERGRISLRTAYRWKKAVIGLQIVRVAGWEADFAIRRQGPIRISAWRRVKR